VRNAVFCDVVTCRYFVNRRFGGTYRLNLQGSSLADFLYLEDGGFGGVKIELGDIALMLSSYSSSPSFWILPIYFWNRWSSSSCSVHRTLFSVCSSCKNCPSADVCRDADVFGAGNVLLNHVTVIIIIIISTYVCEYDPFSPHNDMKVKLFLCLTN
jgi:hypothetical protein